MMIIGQGLLSVRDVSEKKSNSDLSLQKLDTKVIAFDELSCVHSLRQQDPKALEALIQNYEQVLKRVAYLQVGDKDMVDDIVQTTFIAAWNGVNRLKQESRLRPWLFGILFNQCRNTLRSLKRKRTREQIAHEFQQLRRNETDSEEREEHLSKLQKALLGLKEQHRELIILKYEQELPLIEIAMTLGISLGTVKSRLHRALQALREKMGAHV